MQGPQAERFVVLNLRLLAATFALVGVLFIAVPSGVLDVISDVGEWFGFESRAGGRRICRRGPAHCRIGRFGSCCGRREAQGGTR